FFFLFYFPVKFCLQLFISCVCCLAVLPVTRSGYSMLSWLAGWLVGWLIGSHGDTTNSWLHVLPCGPSFLSFFLFFTLFMCTPCSHSLIHLNFSFTLVGLCFCHTAGQAFFFLFLFYFCFYCFL